MCGRTGPRGGHERNIKRLTGWLLAVTFMLGCLAGSVGVCAIALGWVVL